MTQTSKQPPQRRSRRWTHQYGFPYLAERFPPNFRSPSHVNAFIYSLSAEVTLGRLDARTAATLGYLAQLAIQTLPLLRIESGPRDGIPTTFEFISLAPRPSYSNDSATPGAAPPKDATTQSVPNSSREGTQR